MSLHHESKTMATEFFAYFLNGHLQIIFPPKCQKTYYKENTILKDIHIRNCFQEYQT